MDRGPARIALLGNPNVGKSTLFNALTGAHQHTVNAPGTTVHWEVGRWRLPAAHGTRQEVDLVDLPGTQSLLAASPDEQVTQDALVGAGAHGAPPDLTIVVADATALSRSLYLLAQAAETGTPAIVALTMNDVARGRGITVDVARLSERLGVPVVEVDPRMRIGLGELASTVHRALHDRPYLHTGLEHVLAGVSVTADSPADGGIPDASRALTDQIQVHADDHFEWVAGIERDLVSHSGHRETWSDRIDRILLNPWFGIPVFLGVMWMLFQLTTTIAGPIQDLIDAVVSGWFGSVITSFLGLFDLDTGWLNGFLVNGVVAGLATVATFIPPMGLMFLALSMLEDSGYMARAGFVADRVMRLMGLDGRAFLPLVIGFGCNLPALAATRTLPNSRQRLLTGLLVPLSSCTARLTVYVVMATIFFPHNAGTAIFAMYVTSVTLIILAGLVLRRTVFRDLKPEPFVLNLPAYQRPRIKPMAMSVLMRLRDFVVRAGRVIMATLIVMWALIAIPINGGKFGDVPVEDSLYGATAHAVAPVFAPAGFDDWHASAALATGFVAKEVVVGALAQSYAVDEPVADNQPGLLADRLHETFDRTSGGHPGAAAAAFMLFVLAYTPCAATVAEQRRHFGWRPAIAAVGVSLVGAWVLAVAVFQIGSLL